MILNVTVINMHYIKTIGSRHLVICIALSATKLFENLRKGWLLIYICQIKNENTQSSLKPISWDSYGNYLHIWKNDLWHDLGHKLILCDQGVTIHRVKHWKSVESLLSNIVFLKMPLKWPLRYFLGVMFQIVEIYMIFL